MSKTEKNWKENHATKVIEIPKTKRRKYRMNKTLIDHKALSKILGLQIARLNSKII